MKKVNFSVIIPTHNRYSNNLLSAAIESVLNQQKGEFEAEIIVVDDGTPGGIPKDFAASYAPRVKFLALPKNQGTPFAIAEGIRNASGEWIAILGDDDLLPKKSLSLRAAFIIEHPDLDWFYAKTQLLNAKGKPIPTISQSEEFKDYHYARMFLYNYIQGGTTTVKKSAYDKISWPDWLTTRDDDFIAFELVRPNKYKFAFLDDVVYGYRSHANGERESEKNLRTKRFEEIDRRIRYELHDPNLAFLGDVAKKAAFLEAELKNRDERLNKIYGSFFWKLLYPLRLLKRIIRK